MAFRAALLNFSKGVVSPEIEARVDISVYNAALRQGTNVVILRTGGVRKRMGTRFVAEALAETARLVPFQFSDDQGYALEFTQAKMRPMALGGAVLEEGLAVSAITKAGNAQVTIAFHGYTVGRQVYFDLIEGMIEINGLVGTIVSVIDENNFTIDIDTTGFSTFTGSGGGTVRTGAPAPPPSPPTVPEPIDEPEPPRSVWDDFGFTGRGWQTHLP
jgi:hypothetical protein